MGHLTRLAQEMAQARFEHQTVVAQLRTLGEFLGAEMENVPKDRDAISALVAAVYELEVRKQELEDNWPDLRVH